MRIVAAMPRKTRPNMRLSSALSLQCAGVCRYADGCRNYIEYVCVFRFACTCKFRDRFRMFKLLQCNSISIWKSCSCSDLWPTVIAQILQMVSLQHNLIDNANRTHQHDCGSNQRLSVCGSVPLLGLAVVAFDQFFSRY
jgi:hypothetical protein